MAFDMVPVGNCKQRPAQKQIVHLKKPPKPKKPRALPPGESFTPRRVEKRRKLPPKPPKAHKRKGPKEERNVDPYRARNSRLVNLGFRSYDEYLRSSLWQSIRERVLRRDGYTCQTCRKPGFQVHHTNYSLKTLLGATLKGVRTVCKQCHNAAEVAPDGSKRSLEEANKILRETGPQS